MLYLEIILMRQPDIIMSLEAHPLGILLLSQRNWGDDAILVLTEALKHENL